MEVGDDAEERVREMTNKYLELRCEVDRLKKDISLKIKA